MPVEDYVLGHSEAEMARLDLQGALYHDITRNALLDGGLQEAMSVLDIGCGSGDVSRLAASIVGPAGSVVAIDHDRGTIETAQSRSTHPNISFREHSIGEELREQPFDALVGRFILMHQERPGELLKKAAAAVRPGGIVVMVESNMATLLGGYHSSPESALYDRVVHWKCRVVGAAGADLGAGLRLRRTFIEADLPEPNIRMDAPVEGGEASQIYRYMAESCRSMLPRADKYAIPGMDEEYVDTLEERLRNEVVVGGGVLLGWPVVSAWCQVP